MEEFASLLTDRPSDIDFSLFEDSDAKRFVKNYYDSFGTLPDKAVFEKELNVSLPTDFAPWAFYENKLKDEQFIRQAIPLLTRFNEIYDDDQKKALLYLRDKLTGLAAPEAEMKPVSIVHDLSRYDHFKDQSNARIPTGIEALDKLSGGLSKKDEFCIVSARLGIGKSWVAHLMAKSMCMSGYKVGLYSGEMSEDEVGARFDALVSHISNYALTRGKDIDLTEHKKALEATQGDFLVLTAKMLRHNATPKDLRKFAMEYKLDCLFIDQLSLMEPDGMRGGADFERKALLSFQLKSLQQELQIPIVAVNQINRAGAGQEADSSNLAGSDRFGQDATLVLILGKKDDTLKMKIDKARSFRVPEQPLEFTVDYDKGIFDSKLSAMDAIKAKMAKAKATEDYKDLEETTPKKAEDDEIW